MAVQTWFTIADYLGLTTYDVQIALAMPLKGD